MDTIKIEKKNVKMVAHRGLSGLERENTNPAFVAAGNRSYYGIETDVHVTKDGKFVIIHDETTDRVSMEKYSVNIEESNYSDFCDIVLPDTDGSLNRQDIKIPLLIDYIKICKKYEKTCVLEVKNAFSEEDLKKLVEEIRQEEYLENVIFISFDLGNCVTLRKLLPESRIQWLVCEINDEILKTLTDNKLDVDAYYKALTKENVEKLHSLGIAVNCWICDDKSDAEKLVEYGVDFITTDILE